MLTAGFILMGVLCIFGGFALEGGNLFNIIAVWQEYIIIIGGASSIFLAMCPQKILMHIVANMATPFGADQYTKPVFLDGLKCMYECFVNLKRSGLLSLEKDVSEPKSSSIFSNYPSFLNNHHALDFYCDSLKLVINYNSKPEDVENAMDSELEAHHAEAHLGPGGINRVADAMPAVGIVAAVLGIIIAMGRIDGPPAELGHKVSAALTGTMLGIYASYLIFQPIAQHMEYIGGEETQYFKMLKVGLISYLQGAEPIAAVEIARRSVNSYNRPSALDLETSIAEIRPR